MNFKHFVDEKILLIEFTEDIDHHLTEEIRRRVDYEIQRLFPRRIRRRADYEIQRFMPRKVVFDFNRVVFMDSAGIGLLLGRYKLALTYGAKIEIINVKNQIKRILDMSGIGKVMTLVEAG